MPRRTALHQHGLEQKGRVEGVAHRDTEFAAGRSIVAIIGEDPGDLHRTGLGDGAWTILRQLMCQRRLSVVEAT